MMTYTGGGYASNSQILEWVTNPEYTDGGVANVELIELTLHPAGNHLCAMRWYHKEKERWASMFTLRVSSEPVLFNGEVRDPSSFIYCGEDSAKEPILVVQIPLYLKDEDVQSLSAKATATPKIRAIKGHKYDKKAKQCECGWPCETKAAHYSHLHMVKRKK